MIDAEVRERLRPADGVWKRDPTLLAEYEAAKAERDLSKLPIGARYTERLSLIEKWTERYPDMKFWLTTNPQSYIDELTEQEEPEFFKLKWRKKTWEGMYPKKSKASDFDLNVKYRETWLDNFQCYLLLAADPDMVQKRFVILREDIKVDVYIFKNEPGRFLKSDRDEKV